MDDPATVESIYLRGFFVVDVVGQLPWRVLLARFHHCRLDFTHGSFNYGSFNSKTLHGESLDPLSSHRLSPAPPPLAPPGSTSTALLSPTACCPSAPSASSASNTCTYQSVGNLITYEKPTGKQNQWC